MTVERLDLLDELTFVVGLVPGYLGVPLTRSLSHRQFDVGQSVAAIDVWLTRAEQVEVRPVQDGNLHLCLETFEPVPEVVVAALVVLFLRLGGFPLLRILRLGPVELVERHRAHAN